MFEWLKHGWVTTINSTTCTIQVKRPLSPTPHQSTLQAFSSLFSIAEQRAVPVADLDELKKLKTRLKCNNFAWILDNVYTQSLLKFKSLNLTKIHHKNVSNCFHSNEIEEKPRLRTADCLKQVNGTQGFVYFQTKQLAAGEKKCMSIGDQQIQADKIRIFAVDLDVCDTDNELQKWELIQLKNGHTRIGNIKTGACLQKFDWQILANMCNETETDQQWILNSTWPIKPK